jgi:hypothetical protein
MLSRPAALNQCPDTDRRATRILNVDQLKGWQTGQRYKPDVSDFRPSQAKDSQSSQGCQMLKCRICNAASGKVEHLKAMKHLNSDNLIVVDWN